MRHLVRIVFYHPSSGILANVEGLIEGTAPLPAPSSRVVTSAAMAHDLFLKSGWAYPFRYPSRKLVSDQF